MLNLNNKDNKELPLWELFRRLQSAGFPLGIGEYKLLISALSQLEEEEIKDPKTLKRLCCALWIKSDSDKLRFEAYFNQHFPLVNQKKSAVKKPDSPEKNIVKSYFARILSYFNSLSPWQKSFLILGTLSLLTLGTWGGIKCVEMLNARNQPITPTPPETSNTGNSEPKNNTPTSPETPNPENPEPKNNTPIEPDKPKKINVYKLEKLLFYILPLIVLVISAIGYGLSLLYPRQRNKKTPILSQNSQIIAILPTQLTPDYFPLTPRQMKQIWRRARCLVRAGSPQELDVKATVAQTSRLGFLLNPVLIPRRVNRTQLLLLIDMEGSMIPFQALSSQLSQTAQDSGRFHHCGVYYFHNYPFEWLYQDSSEPKKISQVLTEIHPQYTGVLIVSDGGALRGSFNQVRLENTKNFINELKQYTHKLSWLNPLPSSRWQNTTAEAIATEISMFELNRQGFEEAIACWRRE